MVTIGNRIRQLRTERKWSQQKLADKIGVSKTSIIYWERGDHPPKYESVMMIANEFGVNTDWLLTGQGIKEVIENFDNLDKKPIDFISTPVDTWDDYTPLDPEEVEIPFFKDFQLSCGSGSTTEALSNEHRKLRMSRRTLDTSGVSKSSAIAVTAQGNSMSPVILDKSTVFIDTSRTKIKDGKMFALCHGGLFKIKYLYALPLGGVRLVSENDVEYPEEKLTAQEIIDQEFEVIGQVFSVSTMISL